MYKGKSAPTPNTGRWFQPLLLLLIWSCLSLSVSATEPVPVMALQSVLDAQGQPQLKQDGPEQWPVLAEIPLPEELEALLALPQLQESLWLEQAARQYVQQAGPLYIHLKQGGNHPEKGFYLKTARGLEDHRASSYMALTPNPRFFKLTLAHENGHLMMNNLLQATLEKALDHWPNSLFPHTVTATSNFLTAFSEGFGIHFETRIGDLGPAAQVADFQRQSYAGQGPKADYYHELADFLNYAQTYRRYESVKANRFVFAKPDLPLPADFQQPDRLSAYLLQDWVNPDTLSQQLKNGQQFLASEGAMATLFYRLATDPELGKTAPETATLKRFGAEATTLSPAQKVYLKLFVALAELKPAQVANNQGLQPLMLHLLLNWAERFPQDREPLMRLFLETSKYTTVSPKAALLFAELYESAALLDVPQLTPRLQATEALRQHSLQAVLADPHQLWAAVGPELWVRLPQIQLSVPALGLQKAPLLLNFNTASRLQLLALPDLTPQEAAAILDKRQQTGFFNSLSELPLPSPKIQTLQSQRVVVP